MSLDLMHWVVAGLAALVVGFSKTGVPGSGILVVPMMAYVFGGHLSIGATLPMLIAADCFAVAFYRSHADFARLKSLAPWVVGGLVLGTLFLRYLPHPPGTRDPLNPIIGAIVLLMLAVQLLRNRLGDRLVPTSPSGTAATGVLAGFTTMASNAAGPVMSIYMAAAKMPKNVFMGTSAWYFFIFNLAKVPFMVWLTYDRPSDPLFTPASLAMNASLIPLIVVGAFLGRKLLPVIPEKVFTGSVLVLAAIGAIKLLFM